MNLLAGLGASVIGISVSTAAPGPPGPSGHNTLASLVTARVQAKAGLVMRTLTRNARHSDRRLSYSDSLLSHAQNLTFVLGHYFPNSSRRNIYCLCNTDCLFKIDPFNYLSRLVMFFS